MDVYGPPAITHASIVERAADDPDRHRPSLQAFSIPLDLYPHELPREASTPHQPLGPMGQTTSEHCLPLRGMKLTVSDQRNLLD
jgi:hypothetical protein